MSRDADNEYFSDGLSEEIINALAQVPGLKVIARTSAFAFKGKNEDIRRIADTLGVTNMLEGSVRRAGNRIRVTAQLIQASDGSHLWSQRYDREMSDIFAVQDEIAAAIAGALKLKLVPASERRMPSLPAYRRISDTGRINGSSPREAAQRSRDCLEQSLALDPEFALPYVGLADYHLALAAVGGIRSGEAMPRARALAQRALEIDPELPEAHAMLGIVAGHYDYDWIEAERRFRVAVRREPLSPHLRQWFASFFLYPTGRIEEALLQISRVTEEDPLCQMWTLMRANVLAGAGLADEALADARKSMELDPSFWLGSADTGILCAIRGQHAEALRCAEKAMAAAPWSPYSLGLMAGALANVDQAEQAAPLLVTLRAIRTQGRWDSSSIIWRWAKSRAPANGREGGRGTLPAIHPACDSRASGAASPFGRVAACVEGAQSRLTIPPTEHSEGKVGPHGGPHTNAALEKLHIEIEGEARARAA